MGQNLHTNMEDFCRANHIKRNPLIVLSVAVRLRTKSNKTSTSPATAVGSYGEKLILLAISRTKNNVEASLAMSTQDWIC